MQWCCDRGRVTKEDIQKAHNKTAQELHIYCTLQNDLERLSVGCLNLQLFVGRCLQLMPGQSNWWSVLHRTDRRDSLAATGFKSIFLNDCRSLLCTFSVELRLLFSASDLSIKEFIKKRSFFCKIEAINQTVVANIQNKILDWFLEPPLGPK